MSRAVDLTDEIAEYLEEYYPDEDFPNLYEASRALLELSKDPDEYEADGDEGVLVVTDQKRVNDFESLRELDREILLGEAEEDDDVSDGSDHVKQVQAITPQEIQRQIAEGVLRIKEKKEMELLKQLA